MSKDEPRVFICTMPAWAGGSGTGRKIPCRCGEYEVDWGSGKCCGCGEQRSKNNTKLFKEWLDKMT